MGSGGMAHSAHILEERETTMQNFQGPGQLPPKGIYYLGTEQADSISGTDYADEIHGLGGNDTIIGGGGDDRLFGDAGKDTLLGGAGNDTLDGGIDNDVLIGGAGADTLIGGDGFDIASYADATLGVMIDFRTGGALNDAAGDTFVSIERFVGSNYGDTFIASGGLGADFQGGGGEDWLYGAKGADTLNGGSGDDHLSGGLGADFLAGGTGMDTLTGGSGIDTFWLGKNGGVDTITDFTSGVDVLMLSAFGPNALEPDGSLLALNWGHALAAGDQVFSTASGDSFGTLWYDVYDHTLYSVETTTSAINHGSFHTQATVTSATAIATFSDDSMLQNHMLSAQDLMLV
jgi:Ca2+-binding RTX toxin-like protein